VQVGDPYAEKRLIECNEALVDEDLVLSARDLGAAGLGGASSELVAKGGLGARLDLDSVHQREPNMNAMEILLAESQADVTRSRRRTWRASRRSPSGSTSAAPSSAR